MIDPRAIGKGTFASRCILHPADRPRPATREGDHTLSADTFGVSQVAERYAQALFELADAESAIEKVEADLNSLQAMIDESGDFVKFLRSPLISREDQLKAVTALSKQAGLTDLTTKFLGLVAKNRRLFVLPGMIKGYKALLAAKRGEVRATVTSSKKLTEKQTEALKAALKQVTGSDVDLDVVVDPAILGGLVVKVGSKMVDSSLRSKLQRMELALKGVA